MVEVMGRAGAQIGFVNPELDRLGTRHVMGTLRMGANPAASVCDAFGKFHDLDNLYCADGAVFVTSSGYNPTLTIIALALRMADAIARGRGG
jgi:choline dehydrogenase-like flavoprotein